MRPAHAFKGDARADFSRQQGENRRLFDRRRFKAAAKDPYFQKFANNA
jgi:hypothetical protein